MTNFARIENDTTAATTDLDQWPVLTTHEGAYLRRVALPLGGIGTGTVSLGGRGNLQDFEIVNRPAKGFTPANAFFALRVEKPNGNVVTRCLEGPLGDALFEGGFGSPAPNHGLPRFRECCFRSAYPFGEVLLDDKDVPLHVRLRGFNPLIPADADRSALPVAILRFELSNPTDDSLSVSVCGSLPNFIGNDGVVTLAKENRAGYKESAVGKDGSLCGLFLTSDGVPEDTETSGTIALSVILPDARKSATITHKTAWKNAGWGGGLLDFWDDFSDDGQLTDSTPNEAPTVSLAAALTIPPHATRSITFLLTWRFPNRREWKANPIADNVENVGNHYAIRFADAWAVAEHVAENLPQLEADTLKFVRAFCDQDIPHAIKEAALANVSTLRTQTAFRTPDGVLHGWEGCGDKTGCCEGTCTHVWNYEQTTPFLFADLARTMRETEFGKMTSLTNGHMAFRSHLPLTDGTRRHHLAAADGQMGCLMKLFREWKLCGDDDWLRTLWPQAKRAMEFCWIPGGWDADRDGMMEGCQHNTMDVEYYGPNGQMAAWYLGALRACEEMARHLDEADFADECRRLFDNGSAWTDTNLFNGEYYEQIIVPPTGGEASIAAGLRHADMGAKDLSQPDLQLGAACLIDQLVGQMTAHVCGLGYLLSERNIAITLESLMRYNFQSNLWNHFNNMRTFALQDESAMLMATYPRANRPARPFPYTNEVMTGFEHQAAAHMFYEDMEGSALTLLSALRKRYDGRRRNPFNEAECGHHYARAMAAWASHIAYTGFGYDAHTKTITFRRPRGRKAVTWFWSNGAAWGTAQLLPKLSEEMPAQVLDWQILHGDAASVTNVVIIG